MKDLVVEKTCIEGAKFSIGDSYVKIMAVRGGYVMARRKGCIPFVLSEREFIDRYVPTPFRSDDN